MFSFVRKRQTGASLSAIFTQILLYFFDGTEFHLTRFDHLKADAGYAASIETAASEMLSSHAVKRFFTSITIVRVWLFRRVLKTLFIWRLNLEKPDLLKLGIDTMVMDNDDAHCREGVEPTYKKVKGFQPLQMYWGRYLIDAIFRNGKAHSNYGNHVVRMVTDMVKLIRSHYRADVPIVLSADTGFYDEKLLLTCDRLGIGCIVGGKLYDDIKDYVEELPESAFKLHEKARMTWMYCEFGNRRKSWKRYWRVIFTKPLCEEDGQITFDYARPETLMYTNLGVNRAVTDSILAVIGTDETQIGPGAIITTYHERGRDELVNRALKDFGTEHLPFKRFESNAAFYYLMTIAFVLFESFKYDSGSDVIAIEWYATTFRRRCLDSAGKFIRTERKLILKITTAMCRSLDFAFLWRRSGEAEPIPPLLAA